MICLADRGWADGADDQSMIRVFFSSPVTVVAAAIVGHPPAEQTAPPTP